MKRRLTAREVDIHKRLKIGTYINGNDSTYELPSSASIQDDGKALIYNHNTHVLEFGQAGISVSDILDDSVTTENKTWSSTKISTDLNTKQNNLNSATDITINNIDVHGKITSTPTQILKIEANAIRLDSLSTTDVPYTIPTSLVAGSGVKYLKSDSNTGQAYWGDVAVNEEYLGATNIATVWNWDYNQTFTLIESQNYTTQLPINISSTNGYVNGYIIDSIDQKYQTQLGNWGSHKSSININVVPIGNHDYPLRVYSISFKSNGLAWNYIKNVVTAAELSDLASRGHPDLGIKLITEIVDRPHNGYLSMYGAGSFNVPVEEKDNYTVFVKHYLSSLLHVSGIVSVNGYTTNGILTAPYVNSSFSEFKFITYVSTVGGIDQFKFVNNLAAHPTYTEVITYGARANSYMILGSQIFGSTLRTCLKINTVLGDGTVEFIQDSNYNTFFQADSLNGYKHIYYILDNWTSPLGVVYNGYSVSVTGLKTEIYQISPKGEQGIQGAPGADADPSVLIDDVNITTSKTYSSSKIDTTYEKKLTTASNLSVNLIDTKFITTTTAGEVQFQKPIALRSDVNDFVATPNLAVTNFSKFNGLDPDIKCNTNLNLGANSLLCNSLSTPTITTTAGEVQFTKPIALRSDVNDFVATPNLAVTNFSKFNGLDPDIKCNTNLNLGTNTLSCSSMSASISRTNSIQPLAPSTSLNISAGDGSLSANSVSTAYLSATSGSIIVNSALSLGNSYSISCGPLTSTTINTQNNNIDAGTGTLSCGSLSCGALTSTTINASTNPISGGFYISNGTGILNGLTSTQTARSLLLTENQSANNLAWAVANNKNYVDTNNTGTWQGLVYSAFSGPFHLVTDCPINMLFQSNGVHLPYNAPGAGLRVGNLDTNGGINVRTTADVGNQSGTVVCSINNTTGQITCGPIIISDTATISYNDASTLIPAKASATATGTLTMSWPLGTGQNAGSNASPAFRIHVYNKTAILHLNAWSFLQGGNQASEIKSTNLPSGFRPATNSEFVVRTNYNSSTFNIGHVLITTQGVMSFYPTANPANLWPASANNCLVAGGLATTYTYRIL